MPCIRYTSPRGIHPTPVLRTGAKRDRRLLCAVGVRVTRFFRVVGDVPADLAGEAEQDLHLHHAEPGLAEEVANGVHEGVGFVAVEEMQLFQREPELSEKMLLRLERRRHMVRL